MRTTVGIVEDDACIREQLARLISAAEGLRVTGAFASTEEALRAIPAGPPEIVLMDINLPGADGIECVRRLRALATNARCPARISGWRPTSASTKRVALPPGTWQTFLSASNALGQPGQGSVIASPLFFKVPSSNLLTVFDGAVAWMDSNNDGRMDLVFTGDPGTLAGNQAHLLLNFGASFVGPTTIPGLPGVRDGGGAWADYDSDGRLDFLLTGNTSFGLVSQLWRNRTPVTNTPPTAPRALAMTATPTGVLLSWEAASDAQTPSSGRSYNVRAGTSPGRPPRQAGVCRRIRCSRPTPGPRPRAAG